MKKLVCHFFVNYWKNKEESSTKYYKYFIKKDTKIFFIYLSRFKELPETMQDKHFLMFGYLSFFQRWVKPVMAEFIATWMLVFWACMLQPPPPAAISVKPYFRDIFYTNVCKFWFCGVNFVSLGIILVNYKLAHNPKSVNLLESLN